MNWKINTCCFCFPLRQGLFVWGYFALIINYINILRMLFKIQDILEEHKFFDPLLYIEISLSLGLCVIHFMFYVMFVAGLHKKSRGLLEIFYGYNVFIIIGLVIMISLYTPVQAYRIYHFYKISVWIPVVISITLTGLILLCQVYLTIAVRSVISKIEDDRDCTSTTYATGDPGCIVHGYIEMNDY